MPIRSLALLLSDVPIAAGYRYDARDSLGNRMDTAKVIESPAGGYLVVYHSGRVCHLASSGGLMMWTHRGVIDEPATQPTIAMAPDGAPVRRRRCAWRMIPPRFATSGVPPGPKGNERVRQLPPGGRAHRGDTGADMAGAP